jgi:RHS repeat-associated protein
MRSLCHDLLHHASFRLLALIDLVPAAATLRMKAGASLPFRWTLLAQVLAAASLLLTVFSAWAAPSIGGMQITPSTLAPGAPTTIRVTATITDPTVIPGSVNLQRVNDAGAAVAVMGSLRDDGLNGDAVAGDQVYTLDAVFTETTPVRLRVSAGFKGMVRRLFSASVLLNINRPPLVDAGPDQRVALGKLVVLDGSASLDPEGAPLSYTWSLIGRPVGSSAVLAAANSARATFSADRPGDYLAQLIVSDGQLASVPDAVSVTVIQTPPTVSLTAPDEGTAFTLPVTVTVTATASGAEVNTPISRVDFYQGATLIGGSTASPYTILWAPTTVGSYILTAKATDSAGGVTTSAARSITVQAANALPTVSLVSPIVNENFTAPANVTLTATASDTDGTVSKVEFFQGATLIGTATAAPYTVTWNSVPAGSYSLTAKATDDRGGTWTSAAVPITVTGAGPTILYLHGDHLGTPRVATNEGNVVVWRNLPTSEPFGMALPEEDPDGDGRATVINLRFPGQYFDREAQLHYNYFRDYDPGTGRYVQSDPIGLAGGINTYSYVEANPVSLTDPFGLMGGAPGRGTYPPGQGPGNFPPDEVMCKLKCATANDALQIRCANAYAMCMMQYKDPEMGRPRGLQSGASLRCLQEFEKCSVPFNQCKTKCECQ